MLGSGFMISYSQYSAHHLEVLIQLSGSSCVVGYVSFSCVLYCTVLSTPGTYHGVLPSHKNDLTFIFTAIKLFVCTNGVGCLHFLFFTTRR